MKYVVITILAIFFVYMIVWTLKYVFFQKRQKKVKRIQELRAKNKEEGQTADNTKNYWYNKRELDACGEGEDVQRYYHYFDNVEDGIRGLLLEMYDCGVVRTDELTKISYGEDRSQEVDLSFLDEISAEETSNDVDSDLATDGASMLDDVIQVEGVMGGFFSKSAPDIVTASKELQSDDPGITDIHGTLSEGVENVIAAVEAEKQEEAKKNEPIIVKEEKSVEEARKARQITSTPEIRNQVYSKWTGYVEELLSMVVIHAAPETQQRIGKALMDYGYNDVDVLLESPEY